MIHRIEPGYLRTSDALRKREERDPRRRRRDGQSDIEEPIASRPSILEEEKGSVTFDLVA